MVNNFGILSNNTLEEQLNIGSGDGISINLSDLNTYATEALAKAALGTDGDMYILPISGQHVLGIVTT